MVKIEQNYEEYLVEYDCENNLAYISGKDEDGFWIELSTETDIAEPESYAWGFYDSLMSQGKFCTVTKVEYE